MRRDNQYQTCRHKKGGHRPP